MDFTMLSRKRKNPMHDYLQSLSIPLEKRQKTEQFYDNLRTFYRRKWGFPVKSPHVNGKEFDLYELYEIVVSLGGWQKVTSFDRWNEVLHKLSVDENIQMSEYAVRSIYLKYLSRFEQNENDGDIMDEHENELLGGRSNRLKGISTMACYYEPPFSNMHKTSVSSTVPNFHKLIYSLMSGLSNEVAFGLNVITIMSHPGPFVLNFTNSLNLINVLVALLGITINQDDSSTSKLNERRIECADYNMTEFWMNACIEEPELNRFIYNSENIGTPQSDIFDSIKLDKFDLNKPLHWRVFNVLGIFNNLSFEEFNLKPMGENKALIRFLLICCNCRYQALKKHAYETLSNVAKFINLNSLGRTISTNVLFKTIQNGLHSNDKFKLLRSMELIAGLSQNALNETLICEFLDRSQAIARIFTILTLKDILICVVSLETLLQISELGKTSCELIGSHNVSINLLVGMLTTDAASFGQAGLFGIKVVEIRGNSMQPYVNPNKKNPSSQIQTPPNPPIHQLYQTPIPPQLQTAAIPETAADSSICRQTISSKNYQQQQQQSHHILSSPPNNNYVNEYMCEWMMMALDDDEEIEPCSRFFQSTSQLLYHIYNDHLKTLVQSHSSSKKPDDICMIRCRWPMCDNTPRTLWSMTTHLQDVHCVEQNLDASLRRRCELGFDEYTNQIRQHYERNREREHQPGYSPFAAFEAIRRHAFVNLKKEITDDSEGPVTKNLRLSAALILRNLCKYSVSGRRKLRKHESFISWLSLSKMESSRILAQCLAEMVAHSSLEVDQQALLSDESQI